MKKEIFNIIKDYLVIALAVLGCAFLLSGFVYFTIKIDESKIIETRYCSSCGIDLTVGR